MAGQNEGTGRQLSADGLVRGINRRSFLRGAALLGAGALGAGVIGAGLGGCTPQQPADSGAGADGTTTAGGTGQDKQYSFEVAPEPVAEDKIVETITADNIVIGSGCSGFTTAAAILENGGEVIVFSAGTKGVSRGGSNHGINTKVQQRNGIDYTPENCVARIKNELAHNSYMPDQQKWSKWINNSSESMNWLIDMMEEAGYQVSLEVGFDDPDHVWDSLPASHNFISGPGDFGAAFGQPHVMEVLEKRINDKGGRIDYSTKAEYLEREGNNSGRVTSVIATRADGSYVRYKANKAIILATGDFSQNKEMMEKYSPWALPILADVPVNYDAEFQFGGLMPGDGQKMGLWVGAAWQKTFPNAPMIDCLGPAPYTQSVANHSGINLNKLGERFMNEDTICSYSALTFMHQPDTEIFFVWDAAYANWFSEWAGFGTTIAADNGPKPHGPAEELASWDAMTEAGVFVKGDSIEAVLGQLEGIDAQAAAATIQRYNGYAAAGVDAEFHKNKAYLAPINTAPFYGHKLTISPGQFLCVTGGLRTNAKMQVLDDKDQPIEGLYNVGIMVGDMYGNCYNFSIPGHNLGAACNTFPYLLGKDLA
jgi:succinate dehydrogenase/fumarate reductase flavoprotein subunit